MPLEKKIKALIGKVDLMVAAAEPGLVLTEEMCDVGVDILMEVRRELQRIQNMNTADSKKSPC